MAEEEPDINKIVKELQGVDKKLEPHTDALTNFYKDNELKKPGSAKEFDDIIKKYVQHHWKEVHGTEMPDELALQKATQIVDQIYEKEGGYAGVVKEAMKDKKKLKGVIDSLADGIEGEHKQAYIRETFSKYVDPQDFEAHKKIAGQFQEKMKGLLPEGEEIEMKDPAEMAGNYQGLVQQISGLSDNVKKSMEKYKTGEDEH
ncbi:MAG: hypothetical protein R6U32_00960 [Candidatus Woesearchaeota archaeon]